MARPTKNDIDSGIQGWDGKIDDNDSVLFNGPIPIREHTGNQTDLEATFAAAAFDRCSVMVNHTTLGWGLYISNGTAWQRVVGLDAIAIVALTDNSGGTANDTVVAMPVVGGSGATTAQEAAVNDNFADLSAKVNALRQILVDHGLAS